MFAINKQHQNTIDDINILNLDFNLFQLCGVKQTMYASWSIRFITIATTSTKTLRSINLIIGRRERIVISYNSSSVKSLNSLGIACTVYNLFNQSGWNSSLFKYSKNSWFELTTFMHIRVYFLKRMHSMMNIAIDTGATIIRNTYFNKP